MQENPKVSIIIPVYNRERKVIDTLNNVLNNNYRPLEVLLIDDGSTDNSLQILYDFKTKNESEDFEIKVFTQENKGAPVARNKGLAAAKGEYIQFLDSDDFIDSLKISSQVKTITSKKEKIAICDFCFYYETNKSIKRVSNKGNLLYKMAKGYGINIATPLFHNSFYKNGLLWNENLERNQDIDYIFKLLLLSKNYVHTKGYWCYYLIHNELQISGLYKTTPVEFKKRIKSLINFGFTKWNIIPTKNFIYLLLGIAALIRHWILFNYRKNKLLFNK
jgi:glycosyltransferase involved in cell wall biosynthesis